MKKIFNGVTTALGVGASIAVLLLVLYVALFSISETNGKALVGKTRTFTGIVTGIACHKSTCDISFTVEGRKKSYYINRGLEKGYNCDELRKELIGKPVEISHVVFFSKAGSGHINHLACNGKVLYSELQ